MISSQVIFLFILLSAVTAIVTWFFSANTAEKKFRNEIDLKYVSKVQYLELNNQISTKDSEIQKLSGSETGLKLELEGLKSELKYLHIQLSEQKNFLEVTKEQTKQEFENLANKIFQEKSEKFVSQNHFSIHQILTPLKERISDFEKQLKDNSDKDIIGRTELKAQIEALKDQSLTLSNEASQLTSALKGDNKTQGGWGEAQLEKLLELSGLEKGIQFFAQKSFSAEDGAQFRPDYIVLLPDNRAIVIDSKVSILAYNKYHNSENTSEKAIHLKAHIASVRGHINGLGNKSYENLSGHQSPAYVLMFIALEPAFNLALIEDPSLFDEAMKKNIVLVTNSTLLATLRTVFHLWRQDIQNKNAEQIAYEGGKLYDKFVSFLEDMNNLEKKLKDADTSFSSAMNKLSAGTKKGDTIIGRIENLKKLGAKASKSIAPKESHQQLFEEE